MITDEKIYKIRFKKAEEYLIKVSEDLGWTENEIIEDCYEYSQGITLIGYYDDEHFDEIGFVALNLENFKE